MKNSASSFVISLDFEMFWGVTNSRSIKNYGGNVEGEWLAIPRLLQTFRKYEIKATWATVGMLMCKNYRQWQEIRPLVAPNYSRSQITSPYSLGQIVCDHPQLFFGQSLVRQILDCDYQEIASHSYSHYLCGEEGAGLDQFSSDLDCALLIGNELGIKFKSFVFPRNQIRSDYLAVLEKSGICVFRGNPNHWLYRNGHAVAGGIAGRALRLADAYLPISGSSVSHALVINNLVDVPASLFLRPWTRGLSFFESARLARIKNAMTSIAKAGGIFHLWWHPHNFGINFGKNFFVLNSILEHFKFLQGEYGMESKRMSDFALE